MSSKISITTIITYFILVLGSIIMIYPLIFGFLASLVPPFEFYHTTILPLSENMSFERYLYFLRSSELPRMILNTLIRISVVMFSMSFSSLFGGYALSKLKFRSKNALMIVILLGMMLPPIATMIPQYVMMARFPLLGGNNIFGMGGHGILNTWAALLATSLIAPLFIFLMKQSYDSIPYEYEEAGRIDGSGTIRLVLQIYMPMLKNAFIVMGVLIFVGYWNDFQGPLFFTDGKTLSTLTIALGVTKLAQKDMIGLSLPNYPSVFAASIIATIPCIIIYLFVQKQFVQGLTSSGIKG